MLTVEKFLISFKLEIGGFTVGWVRILSSLILGLLFILSLGFALPEVVEYINKRFGVRDESRLPIASKINFILCQVKEDSVDFFPVILVVFAIMIGCLLLNLYISIQLIRGTENVSKC
jgi:hypothetical protein